MNLALLLLLTNPRSIITSINATVPNPFDNSGRNAGNNESDFFSLP